MRRLALALFAVWISFSLAACALPGSPGATTAPVTLTLDAAQSGSTISPTLFGLMFEEINHSGDGGVYAELIANRAMLDNLPNVDPWTLVTTGQATGWLQLDAQDPVNTTALTESLHLTITHVALGEHVGVANPGYFGIPVRPHTTYTGAFYARSGAGFRGPLAVELESATNRILATATIPATGSRWRHYTFALTTPAGITPSENNQFVIAGMHAGSVWFSLVSLFPPTWRHQPNGLRADLMRMLQALHPSFLRFPGGNFLEGQTTATRFVWQDTIGPIASRPGHQDDAWGYRSTDGLGLLEYLEWCQALRMIPVLAVFDGYTLSGTYIPAGPALRPYVQDALDEIQYVTGSPSTIWGARRAADGHPAPFALSYVEIGNEDFFDRSGSYDSRFAQFADAIRGAYPAIKLIATSTGVTSRHPDLFDLHFYETPAWFADHTHYFDSYSRSAPGVMVGEYAAQMPGTPIGGGPATLGTALGEAAWMTGLERNSDVVRMAAYAPLFQNINDSEWSPDLISYDALSSYGSPSYYVQQLFSTDHGNELVPVTLTGSAPLAIVASRTRGGRTMFLTVVNTGGAPVRSRIAITGVPQVATAGAVTVLTAGSVDDGNSLASPNAVHPVTRRVDGLGSSFAATFKANSVTVFRFAVST